MSPRTRDVDGLIVGYGPFTLVRGGAARSVSRIDDVATPVWSAAYDGMGRQTSRGLEVTGYPYMASVTFDAGNRLATKDETVAGVRYEYRYGYDNDDRLIKVERRANAAGTFTDFEAYGYDVNGNRTSRSFGGSSSSSTYDVQDRLVAAAGVAYVFDASGFMTGRGSDTFVYSARGELVSASVGGTTVTYAYDALGRRVARTVAGQTEQYLYSDGSFHPAHSRSAAGVLTEYFYDESGRVFALVRGGSKYYVGADYVGTPRIVVDAAGTVLMTAEYDAFGRLVGGDPNAFDLPIGFAGGLRDAATGLVRFGLRDYDPAAARWTARDPLLFAGGQINLYAYARNNPHSMTDRTGLASSDVQKILDAFRQNVDKMTDEGLRLRDPTLNNFCRSTGLCPGDTNKLKDCGEQTEEMSDRLRKESYQDKWIFMTEAGVGHAWGLAVSNSPTDPIIYFDTRADQIQVDFPCPACTSPLGEGFNDRNGPNNFPVGYGGRK
jgi:RHS repeat-associated protein